MSDFKAPPHGLRVISLPDRLILHDITFALRNRPPSNRNALIDAANSVHLRASPSSRRPVLVDFESPTPPHPSSSPDNVAHRYLVLPFAPSQAPRDPPPAFAASTPRAAGLPSEGAVDAVDAVAAFLGVLPLHTVTVAVLATQVRHVATLPSGAVHAIAKVSLVPLSVNAPSKEDKDTSSAVTKLLESGSVYYSVHTDLSRPYGSSMALTSGHSTTPTTPSNAASRKCPFQWNFPLIARLPQTLHPWAPPCIYGFVAQHRMTVAQRGSATASDFFMALVSRRSRRRAGTRFITRGVDGMGHTANYVETEQLVWRDIDNGLTTVGTPIAVSSFRIIRGSIPVFWRQNNGIARPVPELDAGLVASRDAYALHFDALRDAYAQVCAVSLVDKHGAEAVLAQAFDKHHELYCRSRPNHPDNPTLVAFDFHAYCAGKEYQRGLSLLMNQLRPTAHKMGFSVFHPTASNPHAPQQQQTGVFRVNCVDCLDRTNVVQTMICREVLVAQLQAVVLDSAVNSNSSSDLSLFTESEDKFKHIWGDHADAISKQYSGTGALKTDFTRTGKRSTSGVIGDGVKSVMRMYYKNFVDEGRQEVIDILCGNAVIRQQVSFVTSSPSSSPSLDVDSDPFSIPNKPTNAPSFSSSTSGTDAGYAPSRVSASPSPDPSGRTQASPKSSLWYSFDAMRINAGGDKQTVFVELYDEVMYVTTVEGICFEYPRKSLVSWSKVEDSKSTDRKAPSRLRLVYQASYASPATATPLDLQFRGGVTARENFLRALVSWAKPPTTRLMSTNTSLRVRVLAAVDAGEHRLADWGLPSKQHWHDESTNDSPTQITVLVVTQVSAASRGFGLAAVPVDLDSSDLVVISAFSLSERGPAIAVLASRDAASTVMNVDEAMWSSTSPKSFSVNGVAAVALEACGSSLCFIATRLSSASEVYAALTELRLGKAGQDITAQYDHFVMTGLMGDKPWSSSKAFVSSTQRDSDKPMWVQLEDGSFCQSLSNGISVRRNSLPALRYDDLLTSSSSSQLVSSAGGTTEVFCVADGTVDGKSAPQLPTQLCRSAVSVSDLRAEDVKIPRGVESSSQMNCSVVLQCALATTDMVTSRPTLRPTTFPEWNETLKLSMMPSDKEDVLQSFVFGQVVVPNVIGDPFLAGSFVIALATARDGPTGFDVRCRLGGRATGRLVGRVRVDIDNNPETIERGPHYRSSRHLEQMSPAISSGSASSGLPSTNSFDRKPPSNSVSSMLGGYAPSLSSFKKPGKDTLDDVNDRLEAARKKGAKQMKSVVNKLSSFMSSSSSSTSSSLPQAGGIRTTANTGGFSTLDEPQYHPTNNFSTPTLSSKPPFPPPASTSTHDRRNPAVNGDGDGLRNDSVPSARHPSAATMTRQPPTRSQYSFGANALTTRSNGNGSGAGSVNSNAAADADALLIGLAETKIENSGQNKPPPPHATARHADTAPLHISTSASGRPGDGNGRAGPLGGAADSLLAGLAAQKSKPAQTTTLHTSGPRKDAHDDDDGWGEFESAMR